VKIVWTKSALAHRDAIFDFIAAENIPAAIRLDERFTEVVQIIVQRPHAGRPGRIAGTREFIAHENYIVIYRISPSTDELHVLSVMHTSRRYPPKRG
jgi:addiction module RelE/StbE family toxin